MEMTHSFTVSPARPYRTAFLLRTDVGPQVCIVDRNPSGHTSPYLFYGLIEADPRQAVVVDAAKRVAAGMNRIGSRYEREVKRAD